MRISEFVVNNHRFTFYKEERIEIEEFEEQDFKTRVFLNNEDFEELIRLYKRWKKEGKVE